MYIYPKASPLPPAPLSSLNCWTAVRTCRTGRIGSNKFSKANALNTSCTAKLHWCVTLPAHSISKALRRMTEYLTEWSQTFWHYLLVLCLHIRFRNGLKHMTECPHIFFRYFLLCLHMSISKAPKRMTNTHKDLVAWLMHNPPICFAFLVFWGWLLSAGGPFWDPVWSHGCLFEVSWGLYAHFTSFQGPFCEA